MQQILSKISFFAGNPDSLENSIDKVSPLPVFYEKTTLFLDGLSKALMKNPEAKHFPDVVTFSFWCRKANVFSMMNNYRNELDRLGKGILFHIAPSNVPVNFAYSLVAGLLSGNANIVRLSSKDFEQVDIICKEINKMLNMPEFEYLQNYIYLVKYPHSTDITDFLSGVCNIRIIWGGDKTISNIRKSPLKSRSTEVTFADRYSLCIINADKYLSEYDYEKTAQDFYNDTYLTDQNACTSPKFVIWSGDNIDKAKKIFWDCLAKLLDKKYELQASQAINKLTAFYKAAAEFDVELCRTESSSIMRITAKELYPRLIDYLENSGYFYEYSIKDISEIKRLCGLKCQTVSYLGYSKEELRDFILNELPSGVDRIVPLGKTLDFTLIWDGYDLINSFSRKINII